MRRVLPFALAALTVLALLAGVTRCSDSGDDTASEETIPGAAGAFGGSDDCQALVASAIEAYEQVLADLGDAGRDDTRRIDEALEAFGEGPDLAVRAEGLDCEGLDDAICAASSELEADGPVARDLLESLTEGCED